MLLHLTARNELTPSWHDDNLLSHGLLLYSILYIDMEILCCKKVHLRPNIPHDLWH